MEDAIKANGKIVKCTAKEFTLGAMQENMTANTNLIASMEKEHLHLLMEQNMKDLGKMENNME
jgi:hypothetical protein